MKRAFLILTVLLSVCGVKAQDCDVLVLPFFNNDADKMENYRAYAPEKFAYRCAYARSAFYESDTIPAGADVFPISSVQSRFSEEHLSGDYVVDLSTLSYYAYNFNSFQLSYPRGNKVLCFSTPSSTHPYLVLNSLEETTRIATEWWYQQYSQR